MFHDITRGIAVTLLVVSLIAMAVGTGTAVGSTDEAFFAVEITGTNAPVEEGETLVLNATITNTGEASGSQQIHLKNTDGEIIDSIVDPSLSLAPGESEQVTLSWETTKGDVGPGEFSVQSNDEFPRRSISIQQGAFFDLTIADTGSPISAGEPLNVTVNVTATGKVLSEPTVWFALGGSVRNETETRLIRHETESIELSWNDTDDYAGEWPLTVGVGDERVETTVRIDAVDRPTSRANASGGSEPGTGTNASTSSETPVSTSTPTENDPSPMNTSTQTPNTEASGELENRDRSGFGTGAAMMLLGIGSILAYRFHRVR